MNVYIRRPQTGEFYAGKGRWTTDPGYARSFRSVAAAVGAFPGTFGWLEMVVYVEMLRKQVAIPLVAAQRAGRKQRSTRARRKGTVSGSGLWKN